MPNLYLITGPAVIGKSTDSNYFINTSNLSIDDVVALIEKSDLK